MKIYFVLLTLLSLSAYANDSDLCAEKVALLRAQGKLNVSCTAETAVDMGNRTYSSDFQSKASEPLSLPAGMITKPVKGNKNYPFFEKIQKDQQWGIGYSYYLTEQVKPVHPEGSVLSEEEKLRDHGASSASVIVTAVKAVLPEETEFFDYLSNREGEFSKSIKADPSHSDWNGRCLPWGAWNVSDAPLDREFKGLINQMGRGILCDGKWPLSAGVLKELWTALTIEPRDDGGNSSGNFEVKELSHTYEDAGSRNPADVEDANLALVKLQDFGAGSDFKPDSLIAMARDARANHSKLIFDMNPGHATWNQPIETLVEVTYQNPGPGEDQKYLTVADLKAGSSSTLWNELLRVENSLKENALSGDKSRSADFCRVSACLDLPSQMSLVSQVNELKRLQFLALQKGLISRVSDQPVVHHQIFIQYGTEGDFGDSNNNKSPTRVLEYVKVGSRPGAWSSSSKKLTEACSDHQFGKRDEVRDTLYAPVSEECISACNQKPKYLPAACGPEREIFTGSLPPKNFKILKRPDPDNPRSGSDRKKIEAQKNVLKLIKKCVSYDSAAQFLDRLKRDLAKNNLSESEQNALAKLYPHAKSFLSPGFINEAALAVMPEGQTLMKDEEMNQRIPGWIQLKQKLK